MIKLKLRKNLLYLLAYYISWYVRKVVDIIIDKTFEIYPTYVYLYLMVLGEILGGLSIFLYQYNSWKKNNVTKFFKVYSYQNKKIVGGGSLKKGLLIFFASFFDFFEFFIGCFYVPVINPNISSTIEARLGSMQTIASSIICTYTMKTKNKRHQKASLLIISSCLGLTFILELIFKQENVSYGYFLFARFLMLYYLIGNSFNNCIEKYLADTYFMNTFKVLMFEGICELVMSIFLSIGQEPFKELIILYKETSIANFLLLILFLFIHLFLSVFVNAYKVYCNVIYTPMARSLIDYLMNPFFNIYYFITEKDFNGDYIYFIISEIICLVVDFFGCIYNEYIILFCCGLEHETKEEISERSKTAENMPVITNNPNNELDNNFDNDDLNVSLEYYNFKI